MNNATYFYPEFSARRGVLLFNNLLKSIILFFSPQPYLIFLPPPQPLVPVFLLSASMSFTLSIQRDQLIKINLKIKQDFYGVCDSDVLFFFRFFSIIGYYKILNIVSCAIQQVLVGYLFIFYLFIFGCVGSSLLHAGFLQLWQGGATLRCGAQASHCGSSSCCGTWAQARGLQQLQFAGSVVVAHGLQSTGSVVVAYGLSCSAACGIFPDQGSNPCPLHWQADS